MWDLRAELFGIVELVGISALHPAGLSRVLWRGEQALRGLALRPRLALLSVAIVAITLCLIDAAIHGTRIPVVHDEFSYLLAGDTFAHGRLSNPTHPMRHYLEELFVLQEPTRASKYPPGMGLVLAFGIVVFGHPIVGVWLVTGLACAATAWALRALLPPYWACLAGFLLAADQIMHRWGMGYWGGSLSVLGGALVFGAFLRLSKSLRVWHSLTFALGLVILAISRPFEGAVLSATFVVMLIATSLRPGAMPIVRAISRFWLPVGTCLAVAGVLLGFYNAAITGSPWLMPYMLYTAQHDAAPLFLWQSLSHQPSPYEHAIFRHIADWEQMKYTGARTIDGFLGESGERLGYLFNELIVPQNLLLISSLALPSTLAASRSGRWLAGIIAVFLLVLFSETYTLPHYAAPVLPVILALLALCLRRVATVRLGRRRSGQFLVRLGVVIAIATTPFTNFPNSIWALQRQAVAAELEHLPGKHLVIVRYAADHDRNWDWVHNGADIDSARIVWARDRGDGDEALIAYYRDRAVWLLDPDNGVLETRGRDRFSKETEEKARLAALAAAGARSTEIEWLEIGWAVVCDDRNSAINESEDLASFIEKHEYTPSGQEAIVGGCHRDTFSVHVPLIESDLPTMPNTDPARWYHGEMTFKNGPRVGETLNDSYILINPEVAVTLKPRPENP